VEQLPSYFLKVLVLAPTPEVKINKTTYQLCKVSMDILQHALSIEEKYELLISNYSDFENELLGITNKLLIRPPLNYSDFFDDRVLLNRKLVNLLTSARLYVDQMTQHVEACVPNMENVQLTTKSFFASEYDTNLSYSFMEALRNYVQHRGLPVHYVTMTTSRVEENGESLLEFRVDLRAVKSQLKKDKTFKKKILNQIDDEVDLRKTTRQYIQSLSVIQSKIRVLTKESISNARSHIQNMQDEYKKVCSESVLGLNACYSISNEITDKVPLISEWDDIRIKLETRNGALIGLSRSYISNKIK
jgi:hypothetical protein